MFCPSTVDTIYKAAGASLRGFIYQRYNLSSDYRKPLTEAAMPSQRYAGTIHPGQDTIGHSPAHKKNVDIVYKEYRYSLYTSVRSYKALREELQIKRYNLSTNR